MLSDMPDLDEDLDPLLDAWYWLDFRRPRTGFGPVPITTSQMVTWMDEYGMEGWSRQEFMQIMDILDRSFFHDAHEQSKLGGSN